MIIINSLNTKKIALRVSIITICVNVALSIFKFIAGFLGNSSAMITDAIHSVSDVASTVFVIIGIVISSRPLDKNHPYGHERFECVFSLILASVLFATGVLIGYNGIKSLIDGSYKSLTKPTFLALSGAIVSIVIKEGMYWYTILEARRINSLSLKADAWHHRTDAISSIGSLIAISLTIYLNMPVFDVVASILICLLILKVAVSIFIESVDKLIDKACPDDIVKKMKDIILSIDGVLGIDSIKTRMFGNKIYVDIEICAYKELTLEKSHKIAEKVHISIEQSDENIKHCMVHVNPANIDGSEDKNEHLSSLEIEKISASLHNKNINKDTEKND